MKPCPCSDSHRTRRVVLTGGPGAGKTAVLELIRQSFCEHDDPLRMETAAEARIIDETIAQSWSEHPRRFFVEPAGSFLAKAARALDLLRQDHVEVRNGSQLGAARHATPFGCAPFAALGLPPVHATPRGRNHRSPGSDA